MGYSKEKPNRGGGRGAARLAQTLSGHGFIDPAVLTYWACDRNLQR